MGFRSVASPPIKLRTVPFGAFHHSGVAVESISKRDPLPTVAHAVFPYLFVTGTWIYNLILNLKQYRSVILTHRQENLDRFPFKPVYAYESISALEKAFLCLREGRLHGALDLFCERTLRRENARIIQAHFGTIGVAMLSVKARTRLPMATTFYGYDVSMIPRNAKRRQEYERLFNEGDVFLAEGNHMRECLMALGCPAQKAMVQHIGIPLESFPFRERQPDPSGRIRVLVAATFREKKGVPDALRAVERVRQRYSQLEVTLIGDSGGKSGDAAEKQKILPLIDRLGNAIRWFGVQPYSVYEAALYEHDLFLSPSRTANDGDSEGGAPVTLIEAQASGMPIVSTRHADIPEIVLHDRTGLLSPENDIDALTANLERLVSSPDLWGPMGRAGRKHIETNHDIRLQTGKLERIYTNLARETAAVSG